MAWQTRYLDAKAIVCTLLIGFLWVHQVAGADTQDAEVETATVAPAKKAQIWNGVSPTNSEILRVTIVSAVVANENIYWGAIRDTEGLAMAFFESAGDHPLVSVFWYPLQSSGTGMVSLWTYQNCRFIETRNARAGKFEDRIPWLVGTIPDGMERLFDSSEKVDNVFISQAAGEFERLSITENSGPSKNAGWEFEYISEIPRFPDERLGFIETKFFESRAMMRRIDSLSSFSREGAQNN